MKEYNKQVIYKNFNRNNKWLGIIDYKSLVFLVVYLFLLVTILRFLSLKLELSIYIFLFFSVPIFAAIFINVNNEVAIEVIFIILKFYVNKGIFTELNNKKNYMGGVYKNVK